MATGMGTSWPRRRLGIITGSGPEAGIDLFAKVLAEHRRLLGDSYTGDVDAPNVTVLSIPELGHSMHLPETGAQVWQHLSEACERISTQVDAYAIACNTLYFFEPAIQQMGLPAELVSPVDCVEAECRGRNAMPMALLGAAPVTDLDGDTSPYGRIADSTALELHPDPARVHRLIEAIKMHGGPNAELEAEFRSITSELTSAAALLACTELPLLAAEQVNIELIDVTVLLAQALVTSSGSPQRL